MKPWKAFAPLLCALNVGVSPFLARAGEKRDFVQTENRDLNLSVGENQTIAASDVKSYSEGNEGVVEVRLTPEAKDFVIVGRKAGSSTLLLLKRGGEQVLYTIHVFARPMQVVEQELTSLLAGYTGLRIRRIGPRIFVEGGVSTQAEVDRLKQIAALYPGQVESLVVLGGAAAERKQNIRLDVYFIQFQKVKNWGFGVTYPSSISPRLNGTLDFLTRSFTRAEATVVNQALPGLDLAATNGWARVLRHSTVITSNGAEAVFSSGGEENFRVTGGLASQIQSVSFGTKVQVLPRFDPVTRELEIKLDAHVTDLTPAGIGTDIPGREVTDLSTQVSLKLGQSLILSGIQTKSQRHTINGVPLLSEIPLLGVLFGRHSDDQRATEGAIFVVPSVIESMPRDREKLVSDLLNEYDNFSGKVKGDPHGHPGAR
ncbi:MAG: pilus assembly protein N-terminal domain-containing protein [Myxococcota bacterium]